MATSVIKAGREKGALAGRRPVETKAAILEYECGDTGVPFYPVGVSYPGPDPKVLTLDLLELSSA